MSTQVGDRIQWAHMRAGNYEVKLTDGLIDEPPKRRRIPQLEAEGHPFEMVMAEELFEKIKSLGPRSKKDPHIDKVYTVPTPLHIWIVGGDTFKNSEKPGPGKKIPWIENMKQDNVALLAGEMIHPRYRMVIVGGGTKGMRDAPKSKFPCGGKPHPVFDEISFIPRMHTMNQHSDSKQFHAAAEVFMRPVADSYSEHQVPYRGFSSSEENHLRAVYYGG